MGAPPEQTDSGAAPADPPWAADRFRAAVEHAKLEAMKELAYGASHEINNPLANIAGRAQTLLKAEPDGAKRKALEAIHRQAMRAHEMISDLMLFARPPKLDKQPTPVGPLLEAVAHGVRAAAAERSIEIKVSGSSAGLSVNGDRTQLGVALSALVDNSVEAIGEGGEVALGAAARGADVVEIEVRDTGPGISDEAREHLFDPFFSGREAGRGLGFGLSKCWRIVTDHGGSIGVECPPAEGAVFRLLLPTA